MDKPQRPTPPKNETRPEDGGFAFPEWVPPWLQETLLVIVAISVLGIIGICVWALWQ